MVHKAGVPYQNWSRYNAGGTVGYGAGGTKDGFGGWVTGHDAPSRGASASTAMGDELTADGTAGVSRCVATPHAETDIAAAITSHRQFGMVVILSEPSTTRTQARFLNPSFTQSLKILLRERGRRAAKVALARSVRGRSPGLELPGQ